MENRLQRQTGRPRGQPAHRHARGPNRRKEQRLVRCRLHLRPPRPRPPSPAEVQRAINRGDSALDCNGKRSSSTATPSNRCARSSTTAKSREGQSPGPLPDAWPFTRRSFKRRSTRWTASTSKTRRTGAKKRLCVTGPVTPGSRRSPLGPLEAEHARAPIRKRASTGRASWRIRGSTDYSPTVPRENPPDPDVAQLSNGQTRKPKQSPP